MAAFLMVLYGLASYACFFATILYSIAFVGGLPVPKTLDSGASATPAVALAVDLLLLALFAVQHSVMARPAFKRWWTRFVPETIERSTYVLAASATLALLFWQWKPIAEPVVWHVSGRAPAAAIDAVFWLGWAVVFLSTFLLGHFELFGVRQVMFRLLGRDVPASQFRTPLFYRHVRHPLYLGFLLAFWATPTMTAGHLLFSIGTTGYIFIGIWFEERDLVDQFGDRYRRYREKVAMIVPWPRKANAADAALDVDRG